MTLKEAMLSRHTVRKYIDRPIDGDIAQKLNERINAHNEKYNLNLKLILNNETSFNAVYKLILEKNAKNFIILSGPDTSDLNEKLGYCGADLTLFAQTLGLNTWWICGTYSKRNVEKLSNGEKVIGIIVVGYGENQGRPHKSKKYDDVAYYDGNPPQWFTEGIKAALLAPTAVNRQAFKIEGKNDKVKITYKSGLYSNVDLGIVKYFFELGAGKENFTWV